MSKKFKGFSLAELLISLLVISIVLSAAIPAITKKSAAQRELIWRWTNGNNIAFAAAGANQGILLGMDTRPETSDGLGEILSDKDFIDGEAGDAGYNRGHVALVDISNVKFSFDDKISILKRRITDSASNMQNSHISFFNMDNNAGTTNSEYGGRLALDARNIALGIGSLQSIEADNKGENTALGHFALLRNTTGVRNTAAGKKTLSYNSEGSYNTAFGFASSFFLGKEIMASTQDGITGEDAIAADAGNDVNMENTALGAEAQYQLETGNYNTAVGSQALKYTMTGSSNTAVGRLAMPAARDASANTAAGSRALLSLEQGSNNTALGLGACDEMKTGRNNICIGTLSGRNHGLGNEEEQSHNNYALFIGSNSESDAYAKSLISGHTRKTPVDDQELVINARHVKFNSYAGEIGQPIFQFGMKYGGDYYDDSNNGYDSYDTGNIKLRHGYAQFNLRNTGGTDSVALGLNAGYNNYSKVLLFDVFNPYSSNWQTSAASRGDIVINRQLAFNFPEGAASDDPNATVAIRVVSSAVTKNGSTGAKLNHGAAPLSLNEKLFVAYGSDAPVVSIVPTTDAGSAKFSVDTSTNDVSEASKFILRQQSGSELYMYLNNNANVFVDGEQFKVDMTDSKPVQIKGSSASFIEFPGLATISPSSLFFKLVEDSVGNGDLPSLLKQMHDDVENLKQAVQNLTYAPEEDAYRLAFETNPMLTLSDERRKNISGDFTAGLKEINQLEVKNYTYKDDAQKTPHIGVIAQKLMKIFPDAVKKGADGYYRIRTEDIFYAVVNAVKELYQNVQELAAKITGLDKRITELEEQNKQLREQNAAVEKRLEALEKKFSAAE